MDTLTFMTYARDCLVEATAKDLTHDEHDLQAAIMNAAIGVLKIKIPFHQ